MMLLDTHGFLWLATEPERLGGAAARMLDASDRLLVSAVSAWEIAIKVGAAACSCTSTRLAGCPPRSSGSEPHRSPWITSTHWPWPTCPCCTETRSTGFSSAIRRCCASRS